MTMQPSDEVCRMMASVMCNPYGCVSILTITMIGYLTICKLVDNKYTVKFDELELQPQ